MENTSKFIWWWTWFQGEHETEKTIRISSCVIWGNVNVIGAISPFFSIIHWDNTSGNIYYGVISHISEIAVFLSISKLTVVCLKADPDHHIAWVLLRTTSHSYINRQFFSDFHRRKVCLHVNVQMHIHM